MDLVNRRFCYFFGVCHLYCAPKSLAALSISDSVSRITDPHLGTYQLSEDKYLFVVFNGPRCLLGHS